MSRTKEFIGNPTATVLHANNTTAGLYECNASGDIPDVRAGETGDLTESRSNQRAFQCRRSGLARLPAHFIGVGNDWHAGEPPQNSRIDLGRHVGPLEAKLRGDTCMINAGAKSVAHGAPDRARDRAALMENAGRRCEQRKAVDEVRRPVDGIDRLDKVGISAWTFRQLVANDAVIRKVFGQSFAD